MRALNCWPAVLSLCAWLTPVWALEPKGPGGAAEGAAHTGQQPNAAGVVSNGTAWATSDAEPATADVGSSLVPPLVVNASVDYPAQASGAAEVLLELVVRKDGSVADVNILYGLEPFASTARQASSAWRFQPATRNGVAVAARIHFVVRFVPPVALPPPVLPAPPVVVSPPLAPETETEITEVFVIGEAPPGARSVGQAEARMLPGAMGDPFNAIAILPGVAPVVSGLPLFFVRGAPPGNLGYFIDGVRVPLLYHAFLGPAVVHPAFIERVELYSGGYPASFGNFAGGVFSADLAAPKGRFGGEWSVRLVDAGAFVEAPFADGRGSVMLGGRYSYTALLLSLFTKLRLQYWDYQALVSYQLGPRDELSLFGFGAFDFAGEDGGETLGRLEFHRIDLRHVHRFDAGTNLRTAITLGIDRTKGDNGSALDKMIGARVDFRSQLAPYWLLRAGARTTVDEYSLDVQTDIEHYFDFVTLFPSRTDYVAGAYLDSVIDVTRGVELTPGVRVDLYGSSGSQAVAVSPRLAARFRVSPALSIVHAMGLADQAPSFFPAVPGVAVADLEGGLQHSLQSSAGMELQLPDAFSLSTTLFNNAYFGITDPIGLSQSLKIDADQANVRSQGSAYGMELIVRRPLTRGFGGLLSYTLSRSTRSHDSVKSISGYDRTHLFNVAAMYEVGPRWFAGARAVAYSGVPGSRGVPRVFDRSRARPFARLDLRLEKRFPLGPDAWWGVVAELSNATFSTEIIRRDRCDVSCRDEEVGPVFLPSLGVLGQY